MYAAMQATLTGNTTVVASEVWTTGLDTDNPVDKSNNTW